jgi:hypothetical protein
MAQRLLISLLLLVPVGCATLERPVGLQSAEVACFDLFEEVDTQIGQAGLRDEGDSALAGFPYLRSNRLLAALAEKADEGARLDSWLQHLGDLDARARRLELQRYGKVIAGLTTAALTERLARCREDLLAKDRLDPARLARLREASHVPDDYVLWWRVAGLYPLTAPIFTMGINRWHRQTHATFATPLEELPLRGRLRRWAAGAHKLPTAGTIKDWLANQRDSLGVPILDDRQLEALFARFAPVWEVDVADGNDHIGGIRWQDGPHVDTHRPSEYRLLSYTFLNGQVLPQLNYLVWFPARPGKDIYSGWLDGVWWRVTLGPDGEPWMYDSIHSCGCYHMFFLSPALELRKDRARFYVEEPLLPQQAPQGERMVLRIGSARHYVERVYASNESTELTPLQPDSYDTLRALPATDGSGSHSLFGRHGLVAGSKRPERMLLWPTGIRSPGAMRQWGRLATAFVGRRHFDDPHLIDTLFLQVAP